MNKRIVILFYFFGFMGIFTYNQFLSGQIDLEKNIIQSVIQSILGFSIVSMGFYYNLIINFIEDQNKERKIGKIIDEFTSFFKINTLLNIDTNIDKDLELNRVNIYRALIRGNFPLSVEEINSLILLILIKNYDMMKNEEMFKDIQIFSDVLGISRLRNEAKIFLTAYNKLYIDRWNISSINRLIFVDNNLNFKSLAIEYCKKYSSNNLFNLYEDDFTKSKEFRRTLHDLIFTGKLTTIILSEDLKKRIETAQSFSKTYLVVGQKFGDNFSSYLKKMPKMSGILWSGNLPDKKGKVFSTYIIKPNKEYTLDKLIQIYKSKIDPSIESLIYIIPLDAKNSTISSHNDDFNYTNNNLTESYEILQYFKTFSDYSDYEIWKEISKNQTAIDEILSIIPFNIYFDDLTEDERTILVSNYLQLKTQFGIATIFDWKNINPTTLSTSIETLNLNGNSIAPNRCGPIARKIVQKSTDFYNALN